MVKFQFNLNLNRIKGIPSMKSISFYSLPYLSIFYILIILK